MNSDKMSLKTCPRCGGKIRRNEAICPLCGSLLKRQRTKREKKILHKDQYASFGIRLLAWIIDIIIIFLITWILMLFLFYRMDILFYLIFHLIAYFVGFLYFFLFETFIDGQTLGKLILGIKTVDAETSQPISFRNNILNCLLKCHWLSGLIDFIIGMIYNYGEPEKRLRIMENVSQTVVIKTR